MKRHYREEILESLRDDYTPVKCWFPCKDCGRLFRTEDKRVNRNCGRGKCLSLRNGTQPMVTFKPDPKQKRREAKA